MTGADGEVLVKATTSWLVLNIDTRRIVRSAEISTEDICLENAIEKSCGKVQIPSACEKVYIGDHIVSYSDVDLNGHTNNAMYLVWAMDAVGFSVTSAYPLKEVSINFNHETRPGEKVSLYRCALRPESQESTTVGREGGHLDEGRVYYIEGEVGGHSAFCAELKF